MQSKEKLQLLIIFIMALLGCACSGRDLRGSYDPSPDGLTYLIITSGNSCKQITIDGKPWNYPIGAAGIIAEGKHTIDCNGEISFTVPAHSIYKFDYWGP